MARTNSAGFPFSQPFGFDLVPLPSGQLRAATPMAADMLLLERLQTFSSETFVSFAVVGSGVSIWVADNRGMRFHTANASAAEVMAHCRRLMALCSNPQSDLRAVHQASQWLHYALIQPIESVLDENRELHLHAGEDFPWIPFSMLRSRQGTHLGERFRLQHPGDFPWHNDKPARPSSGVSPKVLFMDTRDWRRPTAQARPNEGYAQRLASRIPDASFFYGDRGSRAEFLKKADTDGVLHVRCKAPAVWHDDATPLPPGWPQGGPRNCRLLVLDPEAEPGSADRPPDQESHLGDLVVAKVMAMAMHAAGFRNVMAPLWVAPEESRACYFEAFYTALHRGQEPAECIRDAAKEVRQHAHWRHPHHWAWLLGSVLHNVPHAETEPLAATE